MGPIEYDVGINSSPAPLDELNDIPIKYVNGTLVYVRDVGFVHDGFSRRPTWCGATAGIRCSCPC